ncbi:MAG: hypothetical protein M1376_10730 [Planctomycetes bacterium]|nr:hypothetical protein [Planctomycetota bacterium]
MQPNYARKNRVVLVGICLFTFASPLWAGYGDGTIGRTQSFNIGALNRVEWAGGIGSARGDGQASFSQMQQVIHRPSSLSASQGSRGSVTQTASASGTGYGTAEQTAAIRGSQDLSAGTGHQPMSRAQQEMGAKLSTYLFRPNGIGTVNGTQTYSGLQEQAMTAAWGTSSQSQSVDIRQSGAITTQTNVDPTVRNTITVDLRQSQTTGGH